jgi:hypothetical protein
MQPIPSPRDTATPTLPSAEVRGLVSLVLFIHLFAVVIALAAYARPSTLQERLRTLLSPYLATLNFDLNPNEYPTGRFYLTHDLPVDVDAVIQVDATLPDGEERSITIPEPGLWPPERRRHYQALANAANTLVESDDYQAVLPKAIAGALLSSWGATTGTVRIERHLPIQMVDVGSHDAGKSDPFSPSHYSTVYEARVLVSPGGQIDLVKKAAAGEVAPVDKNAVDKNAVEKNAVEKTPADGKPVAEPPGGKAGGTGSSGDRPTTNGGGN